LALAIPIPAEAQQTEEVLTGHLTVRWGDPPPASAEPTRLAFDLTAADGSVTEVEIDPETLRRAGGVKALNGREVEVRRGLSATALGTGVSAAVSSLRVLFGTDPLIAFEEAAVSGSKPWVSIMCKFADVAD
jgi:hypothetical protein